MSKATQHIDNPSIQNFYPEALLIFISIDSNGDPIRSLNSAFTTIPDISDITSLQLSLGSTGKIGKFNVLINNANNKYFVADDMVAEISNLKSGSAGKFMSSIDGKRVEIADSAAALTWENAQDFLNSEVIQRVRHHPSSEEHSGLMSILYTDGTDYKYKLYPKDANSAGAAKTADTPGKESDEERFNKNIQTLSASEVTDLLKNVEKQSAFFEKYGGQLENGRCVFMPMQLMVCLLTRRFKSKNDPDDMIVAFTGFIDSVSDEFDGKTNMLRIQGSDVSKIMHVTQANVNPSLFESGLPGGGQYKIWQNRFSGQQGWEIIKTLVLGGDDAEDFNVYGTGHFIYNAEYDPSSSVAGKTVEKQAVITGLKFQAGEWLEEGTAGDKLDNLFFSPGRVHIQVLPFDVASKGLRDLSVYKTIFGASFQNWQNEYRSHLEIANEVAQLSNYEFYADQFGDLWYHQPRFDNYHILTHPEPETYILREDDIISHQFTENDQDVVTSLYVAGQPNYVETSPQIIKMTGFYEDSSLLRKYGRRMLSISHPYITQAKDCFYFAKSWMTRINAARFVGSITILGRPELRVHMPVYVPMRNMVYYITEISHKFTYGQSFTTTLQLKYGRKPWEILPEILDYSIPGKLSAEFINKNPGNIVTKTTPKQEILGSEARPAEENNI